MSVLSKAYMHDEAAAFAHVESLLWPNGPVCPFCGNDGSVKKIYALHGVRTKSSKKHPEGVDRYGLKKCGACRKQFTVRKGTIFEESHIPLHKWLQAIHLMVSSKKGVSSNQLHRTLEITLKAAWFLSHRIREAMRSGDLSPMGGGGGIVEIDETYYGVTDEARERRAKGRKKHGRKFGFHGGGGHKMSVLTLVDRAGTSRSFVVDKATKKEVLPIIRRNLDAEARVVTDDSGLYHDLDAEYLHAFVRHTLGEYGRGEIHTNTIEGFYSIFKRGMKGVYQHCREKHLHRYLAEFDFRYSNRAATGVDDQTRARRALLGVRGKRLTYAQ